MTTAPPKIELDTVGGDTPSDALLELLADLVLNITASNESLELEMGEEHHNKNIVEQVQESVKECSD